MRRRILVSVILFLVFLPLNFAIIWLMQHPGEDITYARAQLVKPGMKLHGVEKALGAPPGDYRFRLVPRAGFVTLGNRLSGIEWISNDAFLNVIVDDTDTVLNVRSEKLATPYCSEILEWISIRCQSVIP